MTTPRLMTGGDAAAYCGLCAATFSQWVTAGRLPGPLPGTRRWDRKAIDLALDKASGIETPSALSEGEAALATWLRTSNERAEDEWERKYHARKAARRPPRS